MSQEVRRAKNAGIHLLPVGVAMTTRRELEVMASDETLGVFFVDDFQSLIALAPNVTKYLLEGASTDWSIVPIDVYITVLRFVEAQQINYTYVIGIFLY